MRWVLRPATCGDIAPLVQPQRKIIVGEHTYHVDYALEGSEKRLVIELDGFTFHGDRRSFSYDRMRQNDLQTAGWIVLRFSYDSIRTETAWCITQLQAMFAGDSLLDLISNRGLLQKQGGADAHFQSVLFVKVGRLEVGVSPA